MSATPVLFYRADGSLSRCWDLAGSLYPPLGTGRHVPRPRNVNRSYRNDNDEPASSVYYLRRLRRAVCYDHRDRTHCSACAQPVGRRDPAPAPAPDLSPHPAPAPAAVPPAVHTRMSPRRVLRDLLMSAAAAPLPPHIRETLLDAFEASRAHDNVSLLSSAPSSFPLFGALPYEIRRIIWEMALSPSVLFSADLDQAPPLTGPHSLRELWASDLFYVCAEAREVVRAYHRPRATGPSSGTDTGIATAARLVAGLDVVYAPWPGSMVALIRRTRPVLAPGESEPSGTSATKTRAARSGKWPDPVRVLGLPLSVVAMDAAWLDKHHPATLMWVAGVDDDDGADTLRPGTVAVVVADFLLPLRVRLDRCTPAQRNLLTLSGETSEDGRRIPDLEGRDFVVLADLYDDWRIDELLSLVSASDVHHHEHRQHHKPECRACLDLLTNKAARHRCISCTRRDWEARNWSSFGDRLGERLQRLCRPAIVFTVVLQLEAGSR